MLRNQLLELRTKMNEYQKELQIQTKNININKGQYQDELKTLCKMDKLNPTPTQEMVQNSYLNILNSRVMKVCDSPDPETVFGYMVTYNRTDPSKIYTTSQCLTLRPQQNLCYSLNKLPNPMLQIMGYTQPEEAQLFDKQPVMCVSFKEGLGESNCEHWTIQTGADINQLDMIRQSNFNFHPKTGEVSIPWEPNAVGPHNIYETP